MKINAWILCLTVSLAIATTCMAQPGGGGRGPGGGRGFGGPMGGGGGGLFFLAGNEAVQKELNLSDADKEKLKSVTDDYGAAMREQFAQGGRQNFQDMTPEERQKAFEKRMEEGKALNDKFLPKLKAALTADQYTRLQQISWQNMGVAAYSDPEVVKALTITKDQTDKIAAVNTEFGEKFRELFQQGGGPGGGGQGREKMQELNKERDAKIEEVLTKSQKDMFATLKGKEFDVSQLRRGFGGPGGPGGPGGGPGGGGGGGRAKRPQPKAE